MADAICEERVLPAKKYSHMNFMLLVFGRLFSGLGSSIFNFGLSLYVLDLTSSAAAFSTVLSFSIIPGIIVSILAGPYIDRHNKKRIMVVSDLLSGLMVLMFFLLFRLNLTGIAFFVIYNTTLSAIGAFFNVAINSSIPELVEKESVAKVNSAFQGIGAVINIVGPILGAVIYSAFGLTFIFILNGLALILAGSAEIFLNYPFHADTGGFLDKKSYLADLKFAFEYLRSRKILAFFFIFGAVANFVFMPMLLVVIPYINYNIIKVMGIQLSLIQAACAAGTIIGAVLIAMKKRLHNIFLKRFFALFGIQALIIIMWVFPKLPFFAAQGKWSVTIGFMALLIVFGALNISQNVPMITFFQLQIPTELQARIFGVFISAIFIVTPLGMWVYGFLLEKINWVYIVTVSGLLMLILAFFAGRHKHFVEFVKGLEE